MIIHRYWAARTHINQVLIFISFISLKHGTNTDTHTKYTLHNKSLCDFALMIVLSAHHSHVCSPICAQFQLIHPFPHEGNSCHPIC